MLAPEASELVAAVLQRSQAAVAALDAQDPERPNFEAFVQGARRGPSAPALRRQAPFSPLPHSARLGLRPFEMLSVR